MKLPRNLSGDDLAKRLERHFGYRIHRMKGSHMTLIVTVGDYRHSLTIPRHRELRLGTLDKILSVIAEFHCMSKEQVRNILFA